MFVREKEAPCSRRIDVVFSSRSLYIHSFSERFRRRCGCCRVCASVFLSVLLIASVLCVVVLGWFSLRLKRDLDFMRRRLSKGKSWFFWSRASGLFIIFSALSEAVLEMHSLSFSSLLYFNTLFYGKSVCNCVVPQFFFTTKSLYWLWFFLNFDLILLNFRNPRDPARSHGWKCYRKYDLSKVWIVTSRRCTFSCSILSQISPKKELNTNFSRHSLIIIYVSLGL